MWEEDLVILVVVANIPNIPNAICDVISSTPWQTLQVKGSRESKKKWKDIISFLFGDFECHFQMKQVTFRKD